MALVTDSEVKAVVDTVRDTTPFITTADLVVVEQLSDSGLSDDRLKQIELYLAAHFVAITEERGALKSSKYGDSQESYEVDVGRGLNSTRYGQQALALDTSGTLCSMGRAGGKALFRVV